MKEISKPVATVGVVVGLGLIWFGFNLRGRPGAQTSFTISSGESRMVVAKRLQEQGVIRSRASFILLSYIKGSTILAGTFTLLPTQSTNGVLNTISSAKKVEQKITIPEGWRREQIADYLSDKGVNKAEFLDATKNLEGRLFPDTYFIAAEPKVEDVVTKMTQTFELKTKELAVTSTQLIIASIVEREAKVDSERALIAGIYLGRLKDRMRLEADPTVQYGRDTNLINAGKTVTQYWGPITVADYRGVNSNYNTYLVDGLPPTPIANPGIKSIEATVRPTETSARYFFHTGSGQIITSRTTAEHNANKAKYLR